MTPAPQGSMITLQLCHYPSTTYIEKLASVPHLTMGTACLELVISWLGSERLPSRSPVNLLKSPEWLRSALKKEM